MRRKMPRLLLSIYLFACFMFIPVKVKLGLVFFPLEGRCVNVSRKTKKYHKRGFRFSHIFKTELSNTNYLQRLTLFVFLFN